MISLTNISLKEKTVVSLLTLAITASIIAGVNYKYHFNGFLRNDNHEYCQIARNFSEGNGYTTSVLRPLAYKYFQDLPQPEVTRMPGYPFSLSLFFRLFGPTDITVVIFNSFFFVLMVIAVYIVTFELCRDMLLSFFSALLTATMEGFFRDTITAEPNIFFTTLFLIFVYIYLKFPDKFIIHGFLLALLYLVRPNALFIFAGFCIASFISNKEWKQKLRTPIILTAGFFLGLIPYLIRNLLVADKPFFSLYKYSLLLMTNGFPLYTIWTVIPDVDPVAYTLAHPGEAIQKSITFAQFLVVDFLRVYKPIFLLSSGIGLILSQKDSRTRFLKIMIMAGFIIQTILLLPVGPEAYYYIFFFPLIIAIGAISATRILKNKSAWVLLCILVVFLVATVPYWKNERRFNPFPEIGKQVAALTEKNDIILTDIPWEITWYADRRTVWLTYDIDTLKTISRTLKPKHIILFGYTYAPYKDNIWTRLAASPDVAREVGYRASHLIKIGDRAVAFMFTALE